MSSRSVPSPAGTPWWLLGMFVVVGAAGALAAAGLWRWLGQPEAQDTTEAERAAEVQAYQAFGGGRFADAADALHEAFLQARQPTRRALFAEILGDLAAEGGDAKRADAWYREAERIAVEEENLRPIEATMYLVKRAALWRAEARMEETIAIEEEIRRRYAEEASEAAATVRLGEAARVHLAEQRWAEAEEALTAALAALEELAGPESDGAMEMLARRAIARARLGRIEGAEADLSASARIARANPELLGIPILATADAVTASARGNEEEAILAWELAAGILTNRWDEAEDARRGLDGWLGRLTTLRILVRWEAEELARIAMGEPEAVRVRAERALGATGAARRGAEFSPPRPPAR